MYKHLIARLPGTSTSQIWASILKDQEITVARIGQARSVLWTLLAIQKITHFHFGGK